MTTTAPQTITAEDIKQAILLLIKENNADLKQFLGELIPKATKSVRKKKKKTVSKLAILPPPTERIPYSEMPFWKANPHLKPLVLTQKNHTPSKTEFLKAFQEAQAAFNDLDVTDEEWLEQIKD